MLEQALSNFEGKALIKGKYDNFIGGQWVPPKNGQYFDNVTPVTGQVLCQVARSQAEDIELALDAAHAAKDSWGKRSPTERSMILNRIADRMEENLRNARHKLAEAEEAIVAWVETALDAGQDVPPPSTIEALRKKHKSWRGWVWAVVKVNPSVLDDTLERVNISLPRRVLHRLDALARATGETRSGFIARMALEGRGARTER